MAANQLYYGDNLKILKQYLADQSVDLIYLKGKKLQLPEGRVDVTFKKAPRAKRKAGQETVRL